MAQFDIYRNERVSRKDVPYLLDVQSDLIDIASRVVVPLIDSRRFGARLSRLHPVIAVDKRQYVASIADLVGLPISELGPVETSAYLQRDDIVAALDLLLTGI